MDGKRIVLGIGSGRCGTTTLAKILNRQKGCNVGHERLPILPWDFDPSVVPVVMGYLLRLKGTIVGDVGLCLLNYVEAVIKEHPNTRVVCLRRDRGETVSSFMEISGWRNNWMTDERTRKHGPKWYHALPKFDNAKSKEEAIGLYWDEYYHRAETLCRSYPDSVRIWDMGVALNTRQGMMDMLSFVGISQGEQIVATGWVANRKTIIPSVRKSIRAAERPATKRGCCGKRRSRTR